MQTWANNLTGGTRGATSWVLVALMVIALFTVLCCLYLAVRWFRRRRQEKYPSAKAAQGGVATNRLGGRLQLRQATPNVKRSQSGNARSPSGTQLPAGLQASMPWNLPPNLNGTCLMARQHWR